MQVLEWQREGAIRAKIDALFRILERRFDVEVPADMAAKIRSTADMVVLDRWIDSAITIASLDDFRHLVQP